MTDWSDGYVSEITYTHGFYRELTPQIHEFAALAKNMYAPSAEATLNWCELGCGQGLSANILAASNPNSNFYATDFNPAQIAGAKRLAAAAGLSNVHFYDHAFAEFSAEPTLPESFDIIALHGIYSWISPENRAHIVEFIKQKLRPGGLVYISYNTLPGWAAAAPLRQLMARHASSSSGPITPRIDAAIAFAQSLKTVGADFFAKSPNNGDRLDKLSEMSRNYLAHEYFNKDWTPFYFEDVVEELAPAKLTFAATVHLLDQIDGINLTNDQIALSAAEKDPVRRETLRDFIVNQQFRRDLFVKGPETYNGQDSREVWLNTRFALTVPRSDVKMTIKTRLGEMALNADSYEPMLDALEEGPTTLRELLKKKKISDLGWARLQQVLLILTGVGYIQPCLSPRNEKKRRESANALNSELFRRAKSSADISVLASPVTGGGIPVNRFEQLFLGARAAGAKTPAEWAAVTWEVLKEQGQKLMQDGKAIEADADNLAELTKRAEEFEAKRLPILKQLQIA